MGDAQVQTDVDKSVRDADWWRRCFSFPTTFKVSFLPQILSSHVADSDLALSSLSFVSSCSSATSGQMSTPPNFSSTHILLQTISDSHPQLLLHSRPLIRLLLSSDMHLFAARLSSIGLLVGGSVAVAFQPHFHPALGIHINGILPPGYNTRQHGERSARPSVPCRERGLQRQIDLLK